MFEIKQRFTAGMLADFTSALRDLKPANFDGNISALPDAEFAIVAVQSARAAGWYEDGQAPTVEQLRAMSFDELMAAGAAVMSTWKKWNKRGEVTVDEKKG